MGGRQVEVLERCVVCGCSDHQPVAVPRRWIGAHVFSSVEHQLGLMRCAGCRLYFVNPRPGPELLASFYDDPGYDCHTAEYGHSDHADARHRLAVLHGHATSHRSLIDFGCGAGALMRAALESGWSQVAGVDVGSRITERLTQEGLRVCGSLEQAASGELVDAVTIIHVLEHLPDPAGALRGVDRVLAPGGLLMIEVPNVRSLRSLIAGTSVGTRLFPEAQRFQAYPIHLSYFSDRQLSQLVGQLGYRRVESRTSGMGIEELVSSSRATAPGCSSSTAVRTPPRQKASGVIRQSVKALMSRARLGEHLLSVWRKPG